MYVWVRRREKGAGEKEEKGSSKRMEGGRMIKQMGTY